MYRKSEHHEDKEHEGKGDRHGPMKLQSAMLALNHMQYDSPISSSVATDRVQQSYPFAPNSYDAINSGVQAQVVFNTGSGYINASTSSVIFDINFPNSGIRTAWSFGNSVRAAGREGTTLHSGSSACNLFTSIDLKSRGGQYVVRHLDSNLAAAAIAPFKKGMGAANLWGATGGASWNASTGQYEFPLYWCRDTVRLEIPLSKLVPGFFSQAAPLPPALISGLMMYLRFANITQSFCFYTMAADRVAGTPPLWSAATAAQWALGTQGVCNVTNMQLMTDVMTVFDSSAALVNAKCSSLQSSGAQFSYGGWWQNKTTLVAAAGNIDLMVSASQLQKIILCFTKPLSGADGSKDAMARLPLTGAAGAGIFLEDADAVGTLGQGSIFVRIGNNYLNLTPIQSSSQLFRTTYQALADLRGGQLADQDPLNCVNKVVDLEMSYADYVAKNTGGTTIAFDLAKSGLLGNSFTQTNNSRSALLNLTGLAANGANPLELTIFCYFTQCANVSIENVVVDS
jgi:hypothetical protein